jgi:hypothetical protein
VTVGAGEGEGLVGGVADAGGLADGEAEGAGPPTPGSLFPFDINRTEPAPTAITTTVAAAIRLSGSMVNPPRIAILRARGCV